jgi:hypothetical protein
MRKLPAVATALLSRIAPHDGALLGDLAEEYQAGRSRAWYWRQTLTAVALTAVRDLKAHPLRTLWSVVIGWGSLLLLFLVLGDFTANGIAGVLWGWDRQAAYATGWWWPFQITAAFVSYAGFALSAIVVVRVSGRHATVKLLAYAASVLLALLAFDVWMETVMARSRVPIPHALFYAVSVALPYHWRSGVVLAPLVVLCAGLLTAPRPPRERHVPVPDAI